MVRLIKRLPFLPVVAIIFGWAAGTVLLAIPVWQLDALLRQWAPAGLPVSLHPPLGPLGRFLCATLFGFMVSFVILLPALLRGVARRAKRVVTAVPDWPGAPVAASDKPEPVAIAEPDVLPEFLGRRHPLRRASDAVEFLLDTRMRVADDEADATGPNTSEIASVQGVKAPVDPSPIVLRQPDPVLIIKPAPVRPQATHAAELDSATTGADLSIGDLLDRIEKGLGKRLSVGLAPNMQNWPSYTAQRCAEDEHRACG